MTNWRRACTTNRLMLVFNHDSVVTVADNPPKADPKVRGNNRVNVYAQDKLDALVRAVIVFATCAKNADLEGDKGNADLAWGCADACRINFIMTSTGYFRDKPMTAKRYDADKPYRLIIRATKGDVKGEIIDRMAQGTVIAYETKQEAMQVQDKFHNLAKDLVGVFASYGITC